MVEPLRHRQTKDAATDMFSLQPPRHISTLPKPEILRVRISFPQYPNKRTFPRAKGEAWNEPAALPWRRGFAFPLKLLESRRRCPRCGSRRVTAGGSRQKILIFNISAQVPKKYPRQIREWTWRVKSRSCGRSSVVERQLPKLYVAGSIPAARSRVFKYIKALSAARAEGQVEQNGKFWE